MEVAPKPPDEEPRLRVLREYQVLDTCAEKCFDDLTRLASDICDVPISLISLVDAERQWFKSRVGLDAGETSRDMAFCSHAILQRGVFVVEDARSDPRFSDNPLVTSSPEIRFYAGAPLITPEGFAVGTVCVIDRVPRRLMPAQERALSTLRDAVIGLLELRRKSLEVAALSAEKERSARHLRSVLDAATSFSIISTDPAGQITEFNRGAEILLGYSAAEVVGLKTPEIFHLPAEVEARRLTLSRELGRPVEGFQIFVEIPRTKGREVREWTYVRKDGTTFTVELAVTPLLLPDSSVGGYLAVGHDVSQRKEIETIKAEFISTVSHELRTPLTSIRGSLGLLAGARSGEVSPQAKALVDIATRNSERLVRIINDILDIEKRGSGKMAFEFRSTDLAKLARNAVEAFLGTGTELGVTLQTKVPYGPVWVSADGDRLMQVLSNLITNALKFSPRGETITVQVSKARDQGRVSVQDRGPGIPEQFRSRIFQKFAQADSTSTRRQEGTGLGLSISKAIIETHAGRIWFNCPAGGGTQFFFEMPLETKRPPTSQVLKFTPAGPSILVCEDDEDAATLLSLVLRNAGYKSQIVHDSESALAALERGSFAAMTLDLDLPGEDGLTFLRRLRSSPRFQKLPVIVVSGTPMRSEDDFLGTFFGAVDWMPKPVEPERLLKVMQGRVFQREGRRPSILQVEDDPDVIAVVREILGDTASITNATTLSQARQALGACDFDLILLDLLLPDGTGGDLLADLKALGPAAPEVVVFSSSEVDPQTAKSIRAALVKSRTRNEDLVQTIERFLEGQDPPPGFKQEGGSDT